MNFLPLVLLCVSSITSTDEVETLPFKPNNETRIIGGTNAIAGQFTFAAAIYVQTSDSKFFCGGTLLSAQWVLTSGHCVYNAILFTIHLGSNSLVSDDPNRVTLATSTYVVHPDFNPDTIENDIGLIKFREPITITGYTLPASLPVQSLQNGTEVTTIGWGQVSDFDSDLSNDLQYVAVSVLSNAECRIVYGNQITDGMACVAGNFNEGTCTGDNGGPLIRVERWYNWIVGVASFISGNGCESTYPSGFTRVFPYNRWIENFTLNSV